MERTRFRIRQYKIYIITGPEIGTGYVGSETNHPTNFNWRSDYSSSSLPLKVLIKKYGRKNYTKIFLGTFPFINNIEKDQRESYFIHSYNTLRPNGINGYDPSKHPGFSTIGITPSEEARKKQSKSLHKTYRTYYQTTEGKRARQKIGKAMKIYYQTLAGKKRREGMSGENNPAKTIKVRKKISNALSGINNPNYGGLINQYDLNGIFIATYLGAWQVLKKTGINLCGVRDTAGGFQWKKYEGHTENIKSYRRLNYVQWAEQFYNQ